jgi:SAM-dependent methyltransferase
MTDGYFDERVAESYDASSAEMFEPSVLDSAVTFLARLAGEGGRALELGIGTGRIALPLSERGVGVHGIDLSAAMVAKLRAKPGASAIDVTLGDFSTAAMPGSERTFQLVYLVFNTIMNLTTQDAQVACFANAAKHLVPGGCFVIETMVPDLQRLPFGESFRPFTVTPNRLGLDEYDVVNQGLVSHHYWMEEGRWQELSVPFRYVWPAELDLMAKMAGMALRERWSGWGKEPFTSASTAHVSVWELPA